MGKILLAFLIVVAGSILSFVRYWGIKYAGADKAGRQKMIKAFSVVLIIELTIFACIMVYNHSQLLKLS